MRITNNASRLIVSLAASILLFTFFTMISFATGDITAVEFEHEELSLDMTDLCNYHSKDYYDSSVYYTLRLQSGTAAFFSTSNQSVVRIDEESEDAVTLHLRKAGSAIVRAHNEEGNPVASCRIEVTATLREIDIKAVDAYGEYDEYSGSVVPGRTIQLKAFACPSFADQPEVTWTSTNDEFAEVDANGLVTLKKNGQVKIIAETADEITAEYPIIWSEYVESGDYKYSVINANEIGISSYNGNDKEVSIPEEIDGYTVTSIYSAFYNRDQLEKVTVPATVTYIGQEAFESCDRLRKVILNCNADIPEEAFYYCKYLNEVRINGKPKKIGYRAFCDCERLESITMPEGIEEIGDKAFYYSGLKSINLPNSLKTIGNEVFTGASVGSLEIGKNVESIGVTGGVAEFKVDGANTKFSSKGGVLFDKSEKILLNYPSRSASFHYSVPSGTETIGEAAFYGAENLRQLDFPETVVTIEKSSLPDYGYRGLEIVFPKSISTIEQNNIPNANGYKIYYKGSASDWDKIFINYYENDGLTKNSNIVWNHKKTGLKLAKTNVSCTYAENPRIKITYSDGSNVNGNDTEEYCTDESLVYPGARKEGSSTYLEISPRNYPNCKNGTATVCVVAGGYAADLTVNVTGPTPLSKCSFKWNFWKGDPVYDGKAHKPSFDLMTADGSRIWSDSYTVKYQNNTNVGTAKVTITGKNSCSGTITKTFTIEPQDTWFRSISPGKKSITFKWKKVSKEVTGYQIQYSLNKNFKKAKTINIKSYKTTKKKVSKLKAKKKYYYRIRTYKKVGGKTYYSKWSSESYIKTG